MSHILHSRRQKPIDIIAWSKQNSLHDANTELSHLSDDELLYGKSIDKNGKKVLRDISQHPLLKDCTVHPAKRR